MAAEENASLTAPTISPEDRPAVGVTLSRRKGGGRKSLIVRLLPMLIVVVALGGFAGIVGYYYLAGSSSSDGAVPLVKAEARPIKIRPENPGGMEVPDQDKEIYNRVGQAERARAPSGERLLPPPETPLPRPAAPPAAAPTGAAPTVLGMANTGPANTLSAAPPRPPGSPPPQAPQIPPPPDVAPPPASAVTSQATITPPTPGGPSALPKTAAATPPPPTPAPAAKAPAHATAATPVAAPARVAAGAPGSVRVAIASVRSEADARREWDRQKKLYPAALGRLSADFLPINLGDRGVFWRIYVGPPEANAEAQARCASLKQHQVSCFVARP